MALTVNYTEDGLADAVPTYLFDQAETYYSSPHDAALEWFSSAFLGLSVFYGLPALTGEHEEAVKTVAELEALKRHFTAERFDAMDIIQLTIAAGARYLLFQTCGKDGFCLFNSEQTDFTCAAAPAQRDLVAEIASVSEYHGIGLFLEYPLGANAHHFPDDAIAKAPAAYWEFVKRQLRELLIGYGTFAGICFSGIEALKRQMPDAELAELYAMVRGLQPNALVAFREGQNGDEDFFSVKDAFPQKPEGFIAANRSRPVEIRQTLSKAGRSYSPDAAAKHLKPNDVWEQLAKARKTDANLLLNTALLPDGSLDVEDIDTLLEIGKRLETKGRP